MQAASSFSAARLRDIGEMEDSSCNDSVIVIPSSPGDSNDDSGVRSMTAKGINNLCSELLELKAESNEDFHRIIISNYLSFSRMFEEVKSMQQDLKLLKGHISTQTNSVKDLVDGIDLKIESEETADLSLESSEYMKISCLVDVEAHLYDVSRSLDSLIHEHKIDEALDAIRDEDESFQRLKVEESYPFDIVLLYDCLISEKKAKIELLLEQASEITGTSASEPHDAGTEV